MKKFDVVVVLGFDVTEDGLLPNEGKSRVQLAADTLTSRESDVVIFSGDVSHLHHYKPHKSEAESMKDYALTIGIREEAIITESKSKNTYENALFCKEIVDSHNWHSIILVTSKFHLSRAKHLFAKVFSSDYIFDFRTCVNRLNKTEIDLIDQMEAIKVHQLYNLENDIVDPNETQMQTLLATYLKQRSAT